MNVKPTIHPGGAIACPLCSEPRVYLTAHLYANLDGATLFDVQCADLACGWTTTLSADTDQLMGFS